ncbi:MAG: hypothetical protein PSV16_08580 [Flavobacterium sp.]|nr:hypothetical protein [Flavobacterium sp.]
MTKKMLFSVLFYFLSLQMAVAQKDTLSIHLNPMFADVPLVLNKTYITKNQDTLEISTFKFYITAIEIHYADGSVFKEEQSYHLVDIADFKSKSIALPTTNQEISKVVFNIGVDSTASVSGALSGDLDATKGMYWAWQSGYINMKIEGKSTSCKTRKNQFQFHIGGYLQPNYAMRTIVLFPVKNQLNFAVDASKLFESIHLSETNAIMIPGKKAMQIADLSVKMFKIQ